jgi:hypothetical protein
MRLALAALALGAGALACTREELGKLLDRPSSIARLEEPRGEVNLRRAHDLVWSRAGDGAELANYDAVRTGGSSSGEIRYSDRTVVSVGENTMVIVVDRLMHEKVQQTVIALPTGTIQGDLPSSADRPAELVVRTRQGWVTATNQGRAGPSRFHTTVTPAGRLEVRSDSGEVKILAQGREKTVRENEVVALAPTGDITSAASGPAAEDFSALPVVSEKAWEEASAGPAGGAATASGSVTGAEAASGAVTATATETAPAPVTDSEPAVKSEAGLDLFLLDEPRENAVVRGSAVRVTGEISGRLRVFLGDRRIVPGKTGRFNTTVELKPGANELRFKIVGPGPRDIQYETRKVTRGS